MKNALLFLAIFVTFSCSRSVEVRGDMFVASKSGEAQKLAGTTISIYTAEQYTSLGDDVLVKTALAKFQAKTDADGKFSIALPQGDYYFVAVRDAPEKMSDHYHWRNIWRNPISVRPNMSPISLTPTENKLIDETSLNP